MFPLLAQEHLTERKQTSTSTMQSRLKAGQQSSKILEAAQYQVFFFFHIILSIVFYASFLRAGRSDSHKFNMEVHRIFKNGEDFSNWKVGTWIFASSYNERFIPVKRS